MGQRLGIAAALLGDPRTLILDEPANGLDPEGILWIRTLLKGLAAEGRTVFLSSHLMAEMAQTAEHLIVIGKGRLIADTTVSDVVAQASLGTAVRVRTPRPGRLRSVLARDGVTLKPLERELLEVRGLTSAEVGDGRRAAGIVLHELIPEQASLEQAFMALTGGTVESDAGARAGRATGWPRRWRYERDRGAGRRRRHRTRRGRVTQVGILRSESTKLRTLRSTRWSLLFAFVAMAGLGPLVAAVQMSRWSQLQPSDRHSYDSINTAVGGYHLAQLAIGVLGVLVISGEYSTGMIRSSLMAVPRRLPVLGRRCSCSPRSASRSC